MLVHMFAHCFGRFCDYSIRIVKLYSQCYALCCVREFVRTKHENRAHSAHVTIFYLDRISIVTHSSIYGRFCTIETHIKRTGVQKSKHTINWNQSHVPTRCKISEWNKHKQYTECSLNWRLKLLCEILCAMWFSLYLIKRKLRERPNGNNKKQLFKIIFRVLMRVTIDCVWTVILRDTKA